MDFIKQYGPFTSRILFAFLFIMSGWGKIGGFDGTVQFVESVGLPMASLIVALTIALELGGGLLLLIGYKTRIIAGLFFVFLFLTAFIFHFDFGNQLQATMFMKNLAIAGGMLLLIINGAGALSFDSKKERPVMPEHM